MDTYAGCSSCMYVSFPRNPAQDTFTTVFFVFVIKESSGVRDDDRSNGIVYLHFLSICESANRRGTIKVSYITILCAHPFFAYIPK